MSTAFAALPIQQRTIDAPVLNKEQATLETTRVLFFAHDTITDKEKRELPFKEFGGVYLPHIAGLRDSKHMLYRCRLTQLPPFTMIGDWEMMLPPEDRKWWDKQFVQTRVDETGKEQQVVINGFLESDARALKEDGVFKHKRSNHLVFTKRYPLHETRQATRRSGEYTAGGVVEIEALMGASREEIAEAQLFFFPDWDEVVKGYAQLPSTTRSFQTHIKSRISAIESMDWDGEKKKKFYSIGNAMLRSSTEYDRTAKESIRRDEIVSKSAFTLGDTGATTSVISEQYLAQTETRRKEDLITGESSAVNRLAEIMEKKELGAVDAKQVLLKEQELYLKKIELGFERDEAEEIRLGLKKATPEVFATSPAKSIQTPIAEASTSTATLENAGYAVSIEPLRGPAPEDISTVPVTNGMKACGKVKANGEPCERQIDALADACFQHLSE